MEIQHEGQRGILVGARDGRGVAVKLAADLGIGKKRAR